MSVLGENTDKVFSPSFIYVLKKAHKYQDAIRSMPVVSLLRAGDSNVWHT